MNSCPHSTVRCLNHYDTFRKYICEDCAKVYICECERKMAMAFLPHQNQRSARVRYPKAAPCGRICGWYVRGVSRWSRRGASARGNLGTEGKDKAVLLERDLQNEV
jgi:hypothetical protein